MNISLVTQYSLWWVLPILLIALIIAYWQYFYKARYQQDLSQKRILLLAFLRFTAVSLLLFLLIGPKIKYSNRIENKPILVFAQDNSASLKFGKDSAYYLNKYPKQIEILLQDLSEKYEVHALKFGQRVEDLSEMEFNANSTDYSDLFDYLKNNYGSLNNSQAVIASDGLYNSGANPRYLAHKPGFPVHTLQLGDTANIIDASIYSVKSNRIGFANNSLPVRIGIKVTGAENEKLQLLVQNGLKILVNDEIKVNSNSFYIEKDYLIQPEQNGLQRFMVKIQSRFEEYSLKNNQDEFVVDVLDSKRKTAICFDRFHPDLAALKTAIETNSNFECELVNLNRKQVSFEDINLLVMYQLPSVDNGCQALFREIIRRKTPFVIILGGRSDIGKINQFDLGISFSDNNKFFQEAVYWKNNQFPLFQTKSSKKEIFEKLPPLLAPFGDYTFKTEHQILAYQKIKGIETTYPLIAFSIYNDQKAAWIFGEGIWRWKLHEYQIFDSRSNFNDLVNRIVQYQALKIKKDQLLIKHNKDFTEEEPLVFDAELYNQSYQLSNNPDLEFVLTDKNGKSFNYQFNKTDEVYQLTINYLQKGKYTYFAKTNGLTNNLQRKGEFIVRTDNIESKRLKADKKTLKNISENSNGKYFQSAQLSELKSFLLSASNVKPSISIETKYGSTIDLVYLLSFIIILMISEWFLKKYWVGN